MYKIGNRWINTEHIMKVEDHPIEHSVLIYFSVELYVQFDDKERECMLDILEKQAIEVEETTKPRNMPTPASHEAAYIIVEKLSEHLETIASALMDVCGHLDATNEHLSQISDDLQGIRRHTAKLSDK